jgi:acetolactate synthase I/II/III large subunit
MSETRRVADCVFDYVASLGTKNVFLVPGGGAMYLVDALGMNPDIRFVPTHHEQAAAIAAEAYARITGGLGCALVTTGPGGTNAVTAVAGAWIESIPLLIISGQAKRSDLVGDRGVRQMGVQEVDIVSVVKPITKYAEMVREAADIRYHLERAVYEAKAGRMGPVWIDIPLDIQASKVDWSSLAGFEPPPSLPAEERRPKLQAKAAAIIDKINAAKRPVLLAGHGIRLANAGDVFRDVYESLGIPVLTTWNAMDLIPDTHPLAVGKPGVVALRAPNFAVQNADLLVVIGSRLENLVTAYNPVKFGRNAEKILVDIDPNELKKFSSDMQIAETIVADAKDFLDAMVAEKHRIANVDRLAWLGRCADWKKRYPINDGKPFAVTGKVSCVHFTKVLSEEAPENILLSPGSSGLAIEMFFTCFSTKPGQRIFLNTGLGAMGYGLPTMVGAGVASGADSYVAVESDGSLMMNIQELETVHRLNLPLKLFVLNNGGYGSIRNMQKNYFDSRFVASCPEGGLDMPDFVAVARAFGIEAICIDDAAQLVDGVRYALSKRGPLLIDVRIMENETLWPKSAAIPQPDGTMRSMPLEDMSPLLPRDEFRANMLAPLDPASENVTDEQIRASQITSRS